MGVEGCRGIKFNLQLCLRVTYFILFLGTMPPKKKPCGIGVMAAQKKTISQLSLNLDQQKREIDALEHAISRKKQKINILQEEKENIYRMPVMPTIYISNPTVKRRKKNPTNKNINLKAKTRRCGETIGVCHALHGGSATNLSPTINGMLDTLTSKTASNVLAEHIMDSKKSLVNAISNICHKKRWQGYQNSDENMMRSLNIYYSHHVMGKRKYESIRKANKISGENNFISYKKLSQHIRDVNIDTLHDVSELLTEPQLLQHKQVDGLYRDLDQYALTLAHFYLTVDSKRVYKLNRFEQLTKKDPRSILFLMAIGGDEAPLVGTAFLVSFLNVEKRIASSFDNFLIFGSNAKENSLVVRLYIKKLLSDIKYLESTVFEVTVDGKLEFVEFKLQLLPNDMKMLCFLGGELSNAATYFTTFADASKHDADDLTKKFALDNTEFWKPYKYEKRVKDAEMAQKKKVEIENKPIKSRRTLLTQYISKVLKSRQEEVPLLEQYIDFAKCDPLHLKNNVVKEAFCKVLDIVVMEANLSPDIKMFKDIPEENLLKVFINFVKVEMNSNLLAKKLISWFNENYQRIRTTVFDFRFRGKESFNYIHNVQNLMLMLKDRLTGRNYIRMYELFYQSLLLRDLISLSVRIKDINMEDIKYMSECGRKLFCAATKFNSTISPSLWVF